MRVSYQKKRDKLTWKKSYFKKSLSGLYDGMVHHALWYKFKTLRSATRTSADNFVLYPIVTKTIKIEPTISCKICVEWMLVEAFYKHGVGILTWRKLNSKRISVMNINASKIRPASCMKFLGLFSPMDGTPANKLFPSLRDSARTSKSAPIRAKFLSKNWMSHKIEYAIV